MQILLCLHIIFFTVFFFFEYPSSTPYLPKKFNKPSGLLNNVSKSTQLMGFDTTSRFSAFYTRENFCDFLFAFTYTNPLLKRGLLIRKEFAPSGSKFFPYGVDPFSDGDKGNFDRVVVPESLPGVVSPESVLIPLKYIHLSYATVNPF